ncbi:MAG: hypothetical protein GF370_00870 [Candidatus Nealsonbacteria bacterium]|nr:hypothetical protein [Candidatus Nealsonbacteria bacterium]
MTKKKALPIIDSALKNLVRKMGAEFDYLFYSILGFTISLISILVGVNILTWEIVWPLGASLFVMVCYIFGFFVYLFSLLFLLKRRGRRSIDNFTIILVAISFIFIAVMNVVLSLFFFIPT